MFRTFDNAYNAFNLAVFCAENGVKCKLGKDSGKWYVSF